ncbi:MAG: cadherin-like beta sandwich domain-containing protein [Prevotellaceae bacterium]|jgi:hypothetical protein|nr:cadherin-like beta sandwich domain-containing protein [Prevotellaceae bacterium]
MKKIILLSLAALLGVVGCKEQPEEITDPAYARLFTPANLTANVQNVVNATLTWDKVNNAKTYTLELYNNPELTGTPRIDETEESTFTYTGLSENVEYAVRVKALSASLPESKYAVLTFKTTPPPPPETVEWNFSNEEFAIITTGDYKETATVHGLDVAGGTGGVRRTRATEAMDGYTFEWKLDLRGGGAWSSDLAAANRVIHFKAEKPCVVTVYAKSGTAGRTLKITDKNDAALGAYVTTGSLGKVEVNVTEATDIYIYSGGSGIEVYLVKMVIGGTYEPDHTTTLKTFAATGEALTPAFDPDVTDYEVNVAKSVTEIDFAVGKNHVNQAVEGDGKHTLTADSMVFSVKVTAEDGVAQKAYNITVKREKTASSDATLKSLMVDKGTITPTFAPSVTEYTDTVDADVKNVTITAVANHKFAKINSGGKVTAPPSDTLLVGVNGPYQIVVLAEDLTMKTYNVTIVRKAPSAAAPVGVNKWWNFSDDAFKELSEITSETNIDGLTLIGTANSGNLTRESNAKSADGIDFNYRLKLNGGGDITKRALNFDVTGSCTIIVYMITGSGNTERPIIVDNGAGEIGRMTTEGNTLKAYEYSYTGGAGSIYLYSGSSGINLYGVKVEY